MNQWGLFKRSWSILWRHRPLWVFGLLPALVGLGLGLISSIAVSPGAFEMSTDPQRLFRLLQRSFEFAGPSLAIGIAIQLVVAVVVAYSEGALIGMVNAIESSRPAGVGDGFATATRRFAPLVSARLLLTLPTLVISALASATVLLSFSEPPATPENVLPFAGSITGLTTVGFVIGLLASAVTIGAERAIVLEDMPALPAIARGWKLLWGKFADYFSIGLIFFILLVVFGTALVCALIPILFAAITPSLDQLRSGASVFTFAVNVAGPMALVLTVVGVIVGSLGAVFVSSVWTLAYRHWQVSAPTAPSS